MTCKFCDNKARIRGMCEMHYARWFRTGSPEISKQGIRPGHKTIEQRMAESYEIVGTCHLWTMSVTTSGYGKIKYNKKTVGAHILAWWLATGAWPTEELDHLCHTLDPECIGGIDCMHRRCINPAHLEEVSKVENIRRRSARRHNATR